MEDTVPDTLKFIQQVRLRPQLWDLDAAEFTDKIKKKEAWLEVSRGCYSNFDELPLSSRREIGTSLQKKWKNHRTCFAREVRRRKLKERNQASGVPIEQHKTYIYFDELMFLKSHLPGSSGLSLLYEEGINAQTFTDVGEPDNRTSTERKEEIEDTSNAERLCEVLQKSIKKWSSNEQANENNEDRMFALSLVKHFKNIPPRSRLQARMEIMSVISMNATKINSHVPIAATPYIFPSTLQQVSARALWAQQHEDGQEQPDDHNESLQNTVSVVVQKPKVKRLRLSAPRKNRSILGRELFRARRLKKEEEEKARREEENARREEENAKREAEIARETEMAQKRELALIQNLNRPSSIDIETTVGSIVVKTEPEEFKVEYDDLKNVENGGDRRDDPEYVHYEEVFVDIKPPMFDNDVTT